MPPLIILTYHRGIHINDMFLALEWLHTVENGVISMQEPRLVLNKISHCEFFVTTDSSKLFLAQFVIDIHQGKRCAEIYNR